MKSQLISVLCLCLLSFFGLSQTRSIRDEIPEDIKNSKAFKRFEWYFQQRTYPLSSFPYSIYLQEMNREIQTIKNNTFKSRNLEWTSIGPHGMQALPLFDHWGVVGGRVRAIAVHPVDADIVYIGAACGGIWKSIDGGDNWMDIGNELTSLSFGAIAIDPQNPDLIYAGSGEPNFFDGFIHFPGMGLFKSADGGESWDTIINGFGNLTHFSDIAVSPFHSNLVIASIAGGSCYANAGVENEGIWRSIDGGMTWIMTLDYKDAFDVAFHPYDENIVYCAIGGMTENAGFYSSSDQGETWTQHNQGLQAANTIARMHFDISLSNPDTIYSVIYQPGTGAFWTGTTRAFKSTDGGLNWVQISEGIHLGGYYGGFMDQGFYDLCIAVDPVDPDHVFIGNIELHETTDGSVFSPVRPFGNNANGSLVHPDYHKLVFAPSSPNILFIGCDGGLYKSLDTGQNATSQNSGLETLQFYRLASHPSNPDIVMGGMQDNGNGITYDAGISWEMNITGDGMECFFDYENPNIVYASIQNGMLMKSYNGGATFSLIKNVYGAWISPFFMHPTDHNTLYVAAKSIHKSLNGGASWTVIAQDVAPVNVSAMAQSRVNPDHMIFATGGGSSPIPDTVFIVKISTDGGYTWIDVTNHIPGEVRWISRVAADPEDANTMYVLRTGFSAGNKLWKTTDLGETWINISGDLPDLPCSDLFIDPDNTDIIYVANDISVYLTTDGGASWEYASFGMPFVPVMDFDYVKIDEVKYLRVATHGRSIYQTCLLNVGIDHSPIQASFFNLQCYPNPISNKTTIEFTLQQGGHVHLAIYNQLGEKVAVLVDEYKPAGVHKVSWDAAGLPAGIYLVRLQAGNEVAGAKVVLNK
jgi:photosystem II stability/assembly factor-like uncharacterized protein